MRCFGGGDAHRVACPSSGGASAALLTRPLPLFVEVNPSVPAPNVPVVAAMLRRSVGWVIVVVVGALAFSATELADPDIWWATAAGKFFLEHGAAPPVAFYGEHGCYDAEPLDQVLAWSLFGAVHARFGLWGLFILRAAFAVAIGLVVAFALRRSLGWPYAVASSGLVLAALSFRLSVRSELWTLLLLPLVLALFFHLVERRHTRMRIAAVLAALTALQLAWTTFHGAFPLGPIAALAATAGIVIDRARREAFVRAALGLLALGLGVLLSPDGVAALLAAGIERDIARAGGFAEWAPLLPALVEADTYRDPSYVAFLILFSAWLACLGRRPRQSPFWSRWLVGAPLFLLAFDATRASTYAALSAVAWLPILARPSSGGTSGRRAYFFLALVAALALARLSSSPLMRHGIDVEALVPARLTPSDASRTAKRLGLNGLLFTRLHLGNWFLLENYPRVRVVWTGRRTYTVACMMHLLRARADPAGSFEQARVRFGFDLVLVDHHVEDALFRFLVDGGWHLLHFDARFSLFSETRKTLGSSPALSPPEALAAAVDKEPLSGPGRAAILVQAAQKLAYVGHYEEAIGLFTAAAERAPERVEVRLESARLLVHLGRVQEARAVVGPFSAEPAVQAFLATLPRGDVLDATEGEQAVE